MLLTVLLMVWLTMVVAFSTVASSFAASCFLRFATSSSSLFSLGIFLGAQFCDLCFDRCDEVEKVRLQLPHAYRVFSSSSMGSSRARTGAHGVLRARCLL